MLLPRVTLQGVCRIVNRRFDQLGSRVAVQRRHPTVIDVIDQHRPVCLIASLVVFLLRWKITRAAVGITAKIEKVAFQVFTCPHRELAHDLIGNAAQAAIINRKILQLNVYCLLSDPVLN
ncbi:hypothetical protein SDC9_210349 [bioreactor metagenome]|uniref:Uncharacterized protein n=1 Tax=bioreactor metagenome TaxID=1076179 RepID=A0A645JFW9_9ZZZZ